MRAATASCLHVFDRMVRGLANRRLQPLGHLSTRGDPYAFGISPSNLASADGAHAATKHERRRLKKGNSATRALAFTGGGSDGAAIPWRRLALNRKCARPKPSQVLGSSKPVSHFSGGRR